MYIIITQKKLINSKREHFRARTKYPHPLKNKIRPYLVSLKIDVFQKSSIM